MTSGDPSAPPDRATDGEAPHAWDTTSVLAASAAWTWVPTDAPHVETPEYLVVGYPSYVDLDVGVHVFGSDRSPAELVDEVSAVARGWGRAQVAWTVSDSTRPRGLEAELMARGGSVALRTDVLACPLSPGLPRLEIPQDVQARRVRTEDDLWDLLAVTAEGFGEPPPDADRLATAMAEIRRGLADDSVGRVLASVDGQPAASGGWTLAGPVCRLWGGATRPALRGRGAYRAVLLERLRITQAAGATLGLSHGVVDTSSPILRRAGFVRYGEERAISVPLHRAGASTSTPT